MQVPRRIALYHCGYQSPPSPSESPFEAIHHRPPNRIRVLTLFLHGCLLLAYVRQLLLQLPPHSTLRTDSKPHLLEGPWKSHVVHTHLAPLLGQALLSHKLDR